YGTIHYGEPHAEQQGTYTLENGTFADDYHTYSVEWEPGEIRFNKFDDEVIEVLTFYDFVFYYPK
ncbi:family 16 glycosylhydrolase, partial [Clostridium butyricum]|uniref:family 16 glycosylhydrolase n=1 Tax=Clostridium butyricum TaxID=1492 RepID=UPI002102611B